ncbi:hypothetical protein LUZ60_007829 [Juncus effusus]|nr:hypothetical protein LUZ60_007829 [Juncus effusus]
MSTMSSSCTTSSIPWITSPSPSRRFRHYSTRASSSSSSSSSSSPISSPGLNLILHDSLSAAGVDTHHARAAREGFTNQINKFTFLNSESSIAVSRGADLAKAALHIAAEDDSLVSHSSVPLPVSSFVDRLDELSMGFWQGYLPPAGASPEMFLEYLERYLYIHKGFQRTENVLDSRALYLHSTLTCKSGSATMLSLIYSEILKMLRISGFMDFDAEIYCPNNLEKSLPRGYDKKKSSIDDGMHILTSKSLLVKILTNLKDVFWPFQCDKSSSLFLRAVHSANRIYGDNKNNLGQTYSVPHENVSPLEIASAKAAQHRLKRGIWTSVCYGDMLRALSACERLILLQNGNEELKDYAALLYHCGYYKDCLNYLNLYQASSQDKEINSLEDEAVNILKARVNLILAQEGWSNNNKQRTSYWSSNYEPW